MENRTFVFDAYISCRRQAPDREFADMLRRHLLNRSSISAGASVRLSPQYRRKPELFWDREEMPLSDKLSDEVREAIESSKWFIAVASVNYQLSKWCMEELRYFIKCNDGSTDNVLILLVDGESTFIPGVPVPDERIADIRAGSPRAARKLLRARYSHIAASVFECEREPLQTELDRRRRNINVVSVIFALIALVVIGINCGAAVSRSIEQRDLANIELLIGQMEQAVSQGQRTDALEILGELEGQYGSSEYAQYIEDSTWIAAMSANYIPAFGSVASVESEAVYVQAASQGGYVITCSRPSSGMVTLTVYDSLLRTQRQVSVVPESSIYGETGALSVVLDYNAELDCIYFACSAHEYVIDSQGVIIGVTRDEQKDSALEQTKQTYKDGFGESYGPVCFIDEATAYTMVGRDFAHASDEGKTPVFDRTAQATLAKVVITPDGLVTELLLDIYQPDYGYSYYSIVITPDGNAIVVTTNGSYSFCLDVYSLSLGKKLASLYMDGRYRGVDLSSYTQTGWIFCRAEYEGVYCLTAFDIPAAYWQDGELVRELNSFRSAAFADGIDSWCADSSMVYVLGGRRLHALTMSNLSLIDALAGISAPEISLELQDNELIADSSYSGGIVDELIAVNENYTIVVGAVPHRAGFSDTSGEDASVWLAHTEDEALTPIIRFTSPSGAAAQYYSSTAGCFGFVDYTAGEPVQSFNIYSYDRLGELCTQVFPARD